LKEVSLVFLLDSERIHLTTRKELNKVSCCVGGVAVLKLRQKDGKILAINHYK